MIDWQEWKHRLLEGLDLSCDRVTLPELFAPEGVFEDPANPPTTDIAAIEQQTRDFCPDWSQELNSFYHGQDWAVFEWTGGGGFIGLPDGRAAGVPVSMKGMTMLHLDDEGRVVSWRDYLDRKEMFDQIKAATR